jgi:hypothetical protein
LNSSGALSPGVTLCRLMVVLSVRLEGKTRILRVALAAP